MRGSYAEWRKAEDERRAKAKAERLAAYEGWLEHGSDRLEDAWVSVCSYAEDHDVQPLPLVDVVKMIRTGGPIIVPTKWGHKEVWLDQNQEKVRQLYLTGRREAEMLNRTRIPQLAWEELGIDATMDQIEVRYEQPKENTKLYYIQALKINGHWRPIRQRVVYFVPQVLGKERANDTKKWTPGVTLAACCISRRHMHYVGRYTGLYPLDLDGTDDVPDLRRRAIAHPWVRLVFTSITGSGLRVCALGPAAKNADDYKSIYRRLSDRLCQQLGMQNKADDACHDPARLTFLPYDPEIFFQP